MITKKTMTAADLETLYNNLYSSIPASVHNKVRNCPPTCRLQYAKVLAGNFRVSKAKALKMKCYECVNFEDIHKRIAACSCFSCPLWRVRPYKN